MKFKNLYIFALVVMFVFSMVSISMADTAISGSNANTNSQSSAAGGSASSSSRVGDIAPIQNTQIGIGGQSTSVGGQATTNDIDMSGGDQANAQTTSVGGQTNAQQINIGGDTVYGSDLSRGRSFVIPGDVQYGPVLNYFGQPLPSDGFQPVEQLIMYSCWFTEGALESMMKGTEKASAEFKVANMNVPPAPLDPDGKTKWIKIVISLKKYESENFAFKGFVTARSENKKTTMTETMAKAAYSAMQNGCNVIHFTAQGAVRDVESFGWGIGFNTTQAQVYSGDMTKSNVSSGGFGISAATAGTRDKPWLQGFGLIDYTLTYPEK